MSYQGRGPKPRKHVVVDDTAASVVRQAFNRFLCGEVHHVDHGS
jgi:hypothetical protein